MTAVGPTAETERPGAPSAADPPRGSETPTGEPVEPQHDLSAALTVLDTLGPRPLPEHVAVYEELHEQLQAALATIDGR